MIEDFGVEEKTEKKPVVEKVVEKTHEAMKKDSGYLVIRRIGEQKILSIPWMSLLGIEYVPNSVVFYYLENGFFRKQRSVVYRKVPARLTFHTAKNSYVFYLINLTPETRDQLYPCFNGMLEGATYPLWDIKEAMFGEINLAKGQTFNDTEVYAELKKDTTLVFEEVGYV